MDQNLRNLLNKKFGKDVIQVASVMQGLDIPRISTGSIAMNIETGGGFPKGRLIEIYGREGSGKTYISLKTVAEAQKQSPKPVMWIDAEGVFDPEWSKRQGVDLTRLEIAKVDTLEQAGTILDTIVRSNAYSVIVLDSVAALLPEEDLDKSMDESERIGNRAMLMNRVVRKIQSALNVREGDLINETLVIFINQVREEIGVMYGDPTTTPGGLGIRFCASIRIEMRRGDLIKDKPLEGESGQTPDGKMIIGVTLKFKTVKNKTFCPLKTGQFILFTLRDKLGGIDRTDEIIRYGIVSGVIGHSGPSYSIGDQKFMGKDALQYYIEKDPTLIEKIYEEIRKVYK